MKIRPRSNFLFSVLEIGKITTIRFLWCQFWIKTYWSIILWDNLSLIKSYWPLLRLICFSEIWLFAYWVILHGFMSSKYFFFSIFFFRIISRVNTAWIQIRRDVLSRPDLGPNSLQRLSAGDASRQTSRKPTTDSHLKYYYFIIFMFNTFIYLTRSYYDLFSPA